MNNEQNKKLSILRENLRKYLPENSLDILGSWTNKIVKLSSIKRGKLDIKKIEYLNASLKNLDESGYIKMPEEPTVEKVNLKAIESQRLHSGDLILGFRGRMGRVGLVNTDYEIPLIGNNGMIKIVFNEERKASTPIYVKDYLETKLIKSFLNSMLVDKNGSLFLEPEILKNLPIPKYEENPKQYRYTEFLNRRKILIDYMEEILDICKLLEYETFFIQNISFENVDKFDKFDKFDKIDELNKKIERCIDEINHIGDHLNLRKVIKGETNILSIDFNELVDNSF